MCANRPGHVADAHALPSYDCPTHQAPPFEGGGVSQLLVRDCQPLVPQPVGHADHAVKAPQSPLVTAMQAGPQINKSAAFYVHGSQVGLKNRLATIYSGRLVSGN